jgi:hypothetical protein
MTRIVSDWESVHWELVGLAAARARHEHALVKALRRAFDAEVWKAMGYGSFFEYTERVVGLSARQTEERLRVARELGELPLLDESLGKGDIHFSALREVTRVATPETEKEWLAAVQGKSVGEIEKMVAGRTRGDRPSDPVTPEARRHRIVLDLSPEAYALYREAQGQLRKQSDEHMTDEDGLVLMARQSLSGPRDEGRSSYQIMMSICEVCERATLDARGEVVPVDAVAAETALCDAQHMDEKGHVKQDVPPATRRLVVRRQHGKCAVPSCRHAVFNDVHHLDLRSEGGNHDPERLILLCGMHHTAAHEGRLIIEGVFASGLTFRHADGTVYGEPVSPAAATRFADAFEALKGMGFKEKEARVKVDRARPHVGANATTADVIKLALRQTSA